MMYLKCLSSVSTVYDVSQVSRPNPLAPSPSNLSHTLTSTHTHHQHISPHRHLPHCIQKGSGNSTAQKTYMKHFSFRKLQTCLSPSIHSQNTRTSCLQTGLIVSFTEQQTVRCQIGVSKQSLKRDIKSKLVQCLIGLKVLPMSNTADDVVTGGVLSHENVAVERFSLGDEDRQNGKVDAEAEVESDSKAGLLPFDPFSPSSVDSREDARLKVRLARLHYEAQEKAQARQAELNLRL